MADLSNLKISNTFVRLLQVDPTTSALQDGGGSNPSTLLFDRTTLKYVDGNEALNYVLTSDAAGNASWAAAGGGSSDIYWSANTDGSISPSGLTTNIGVGTSTPNKPLTVVGDISGTTDLYLGSSTHTASTITAEETLTIKGTSGNDYLYLGNDRLDMYMDGAQLVEMLPTSITFNASSNDIDFSVNSDDGVKLLRTIADKNIVRLSDYVSINKHDTWTWENEQKQALAVSGTSVFYSGGSSHNNEAIVAIGNISGTTDLYIDGNMYSGTTNLLDIFASSAITNQDVYWSANTDGSITTSGNTDVRISGNTYVSGDTHTTNLVLAANGYIMPSTSSNTIKMRAQTYDGEMLSIGPDLLQVNMNSNASLQISPTQVTFNTTNQDQDFRVMSDTGNQSIETNAQYDLLALGTAGGTSIGGTTSRWPTVNGQPTTANKTLLVNGITTIYSGGPETYSWSGDTTALSVVGDISGETNMSIGRNLVVTGNTVLNGTLSATTSLNVGNGDGTISAATITSSGDMTASGDLYTDMIRRESSNSATTKIKNNANNWETYAGSSSLWSTKVLSHELQVGQNGAGFISAATINAPSISATTLYGTIDGGSF